MLVSPVRPLPFCDALVKEVLVFYTVGNLEYRMPFADFEVLCSINLKNKLSYYVLIVI